MQKGLAKQHYYSNWKARTSNGIHTYVTLTIQTFMRICFALNCRHADVCRSALLFATTRPIHSSFSVALDGIKGTVHFWRHGNCADMVMHLFTLVIDWKQDE